MKNPWKLVAIIFIIMFVLETLLLVAWWSYGSKAIDQDNECAFNVCKLYDAYQVDYINNVCYCYYNGEIKYSEYMR